METECKKLEPVTHSIACLDRLVCHGAHREGEQQTDKLKKIMILKELKNNLGG